MAQFTYLQVQHSKTGDTMGQPLSYDTRDEYLAEYHQKMKNAINNPDILGMDILVVDMQLAEVFRDKWIREIAPVEPEPTPEEPQE